MDLTLLCRVLHIAATCTSLGGLFYARLVLWPLVPTLPENQRQAFLEAAIKRFAWIKWTGVIVVVISGLIQWYITWPSVLNQRLYLICFAVKMLGALGLFSITFLLVLPSDRLRGMQRHRGFWSLINLICALTILIGAALMRNVRQF